MLPQYILTTFAYGATRRCMHLKGAKVCVYDPSSSSYKTVPMLTSTKVMTAAAAGCVATFAWPLYVYWDVRSLELSAKHPELAACAMNCSPECLFNYLFL